jgi:hypothetical protein
MEREGFIHHIYFLKGKRGWVWQIPINYENALNQIDLSKNRLI